MVSPHDGTAPLPGSLHQSLNGFLKHGPFTDCFIAAIDDGIGNRLSAVEQERSRQAQFQALVDRVVRKAHEHPRLHTLEALVQDVGVTDEDAVAALEFVYSCLVNHFKGELAEILARPLLRTWASFVASVGLIPSDVEIVPGHDLRAPQPGRGSGQHKCADGLLLVTGEHSVRLPQGRDLVVPSDGVVIGAVVEIKAQREPLAEVLKQLANHIQRFSLPWNLRGKDIDPTRTYIAQCFAGGRTTWVPATKPIVVDRVPRLFVRSCNRTGPVVTPESLAPMVWVAELSFTAKELLEAAFRFAMWLASQVGTGTFARGRTGEASQTEDVSGALAIGPTAEDRLLQALYHLGREGFVTQASTSARRGAKTFFWLYNVFSYGRERARGDRLQWPDEHPELPRHKGDLFEPPVPSSVEAASIAHIGASHRAYARSRLDEAKQLLAQAREAGVPTSHAYKVAWLLGMIAYREGRFADALRLFPGPGPDKQDRWWRRDQAMAARLEVRAGSPAAARELLTTLEPIDQWGDPAFPIEHHGVAALLALRQNQDSSRQSAVEDGLARLEALRAENRQRRKRGRSELSTVHPQTVQMAVFDLVAVLAATGRASEAIHHLTQLGGLDGWEQEYLARDELLAPVFGVPENLARLATWLEREQGN